MFLLVNGMDSYIDIYINILLCYHFFYHVVSFIFMLVYYKHWLNHDAVYWFLLYCLRCIWFHCDRFMIDYRAHWLELPVLMVRHACHPSRRDRRNTQWMRFPSDTMDLSSLQLVPNDLKNVQMQIFWSCIYLSLLNNHLRTVYKPGCCSANLISLSAY